MAKKPAEPAVKNTVAGDIAALLAGALLPLALAPFKLWWFAPLPLVAYLLLTRGLPLRQRYLRSLLFGLGSYGTGVSWVYVSIHDYGYLPVPVAGLITLLFVTGITLLFGIPLLLWHRWLQDRPLGTLLGFPAAWVLAEWYRSWVLTGFPWLFLGYSQTETLAGGWAPLGGVYGLSLWLALLAASVACWIATRQRPWLPPLLLAVLAGGGALLDRIEWTQPVPGRVQAAALVQGNVPQLQKWKPEQRAAIRQLFEDLSEPLWQPGQLVVWPEAAIPELYTPDHPFFAAMDERATASSSALVTGVPSRQVLEDGSYSYHNSLLGLGTANGFYHKQRLVPFGEYVPLQQWLEGLLDFFHMPISEFRIGLSGQANIETGTLQLASSICYEVAYPALVAEQVGDADALLTVSNDTWFGNSIGPHQHLQMAQMRARENGREMLRATSNGISAFIDHKGGLVSRSPQFERFVLQGTVQAYQGKTPYQRFGDAPVLLCCVLLLLAGWRQHRAQR